MQPLARLVRRLRPHLHGSSRRTLLPDLSAGLAVAALAVPQGMAYALVAGVPVEMGLWAAALPAIMAAWFGSSPYLMTGPTQPVALVLGLSVVGPVVAAGGAVPIETVLQVALVAGLLLAVFGLAGMGAASRFLSDSVVAGLVAGVGVLIVVGQLPQIVGLDTPAAQAGPGVPQIWPMIVDGAHALGLLDPRSAALVVGVPAAVLALRRIDARIPGALLSLAGASLLAWALGWGSGPEALRALQGAALGLPVLRLPTLPDPGAVGPAGLAIALLVTVQSTAAARALTGPREPRVDPDRELLAQGVGNLAAALAGALPTSGSFSRSSLARLAGARSRLTGVFSGLAILALLPVLGPLLVYVPLAALSGLVILAGLDLIDRSALRRAGATRGDAFVLVVTIGATLWLDVVQAIYAGLFLSLLLLVRRGGRLQMVEIVHAGAERLREISLDARTGTAPVTVLHLEGDLNFAVAPELGERLMQIGTRGARVVILRLKRARHLDATVVEAMRRVFAELRAQDVTVVLCGLGDDLAKLLEGTELAEVLGDEGLLRAGPRLMEGYERAIGRARRLLAPLTDEQLFRHEDPAPWSYEI